MATMKKWEREWREGEQREKFGGIVRKNGSVKEEDEDIKNEAGKFVEEKFNTEI